MKDDADQIIRDVGRRIAELREARGLTAKALAEQIGIEPANLYRIERGEQNLTIRMMVRIAKALGVKPAELFEPPGETR